MTNAIIHVHNVAGKIRRETRNGMEYIIAPSYTLKNGIVMNGIKYEADEIDKSYRSLEGSLAPYGHPTINGKFVPALDPEALVHNHVFAWNENVRREGDRIALDKVINVERASQSENGKAVLAAIEKGEPMHTSTGLFCTLEATNAEDHKYIARDIVFDHDSILPPGEQGAATPDQGVGIFVNSKGESEEILVVNSFIDRADENLEWAVESLARALEQKQKASVFERLKQAILEAVGLDPKSETEMEDDMSAEELKALTVEVKNQLAEAVDKITNSLDEKIKTAVANEIKPLTDNLAEMKNNQEAKDKAELKGLKEKILKANRLSKYAVEKLDLVVARELAKDCVPGQAAPLAVGNFMLNGAKSPLDEYQLPEGDK